MPGSTDARMAAARADLQMGKVGSFFADGRKTRRLTCAHPRTMHALRARTFVSWFALLHTILRVHVDGIRRLTKFWKTELSRKSVRLCSEIPILPVCCCNIDLVCYDKLWRCNGGHHQNSSHCAQKFVSFVISLHGRTNQNFSRNAKKEVHIVSF